MQVNIPAGGGGGGGGNWENSVLLYMSCDTTKPVFWVFDKVRQKPVCSATEDGYKLEIFEREKLYCPCSENKGVDQLRSYCDADLRLCFRIGKNLVFS